jgi:hypothetical protein
MSLRRGTPKARKWVSGRRTPLKSRSARKQADKPSEDKIRQVVFARDYQTCRMAWHQDSECAGPLTYHHLRKAGAGGAYTVDNGVTLCAGHNTWVEDHPEEATMLGLVVREGDPGWESLGRRANR